MAAPVLFLAVEGCKKTDGSANAGGTVSFRVPGAQTQAVVYSDSLGTSILSQPVTLDGYGRADVFVTSVVDMDIFDSTGALVKTIARATAVHSGQVDVENTSFTGVSTSTGQTVAGGRTSLSTMETTAKTSLGGVDYKYQDSAAGTERPVKTVLRERGLSVKDRGAQGDGLADDTAAFTEAISLLKAAGGGNLLVPPGTYLVSGLVVDFSGLTIVGNGINVSIIKLTSLASHLVDASGSGINFGIQDLQLTATGVTGGAAIYTNAQGCSIRNVKITQLFTCGIKVYGGAFAVDIRNCNIGAEAGTPGTCIYVIGTPTQAVTIDTCYLYGTAAGLGVIVGAAGVADYVSNVTISNCLFDSLATGITLAAAGLGYGLRINGNSLSGCTTPYDFGRSARSAGIEEAGNSLGTGIPTEVVGIAAASHSTLCGPYTTVSAGTGALDLIESTNWRKGDVARLKFSGNVAVTHNTAASTVYKPILLSAAGTFNATANDTLTLLWDGTSWIELSRTVI